MRMEIEFNKDEFMAEVTDIVKETVMMALDNKSYGRRYDEDIKRAVIEEIAHQYIEKFGEKIIQGMNIEDIRELVRNRAILLGAKQTLEG